MHNVLALGLLFLLAGCGKDSAAPAAAAACSGDHNGTWWGETTADRIRFSDDCGFSYTGAASACVSAGTYAAPLGANGTVLVTIASSTGGTCLPAGGYTCSYLIAAGTLTFNCGAGNFAYRK